MVAVKKNMIPTVLTFIRYNVVDRIRHLHATCIWENVTQMNRLNRFALGLFVAGGLTAAAAAPPACDPDNGGITLPAGFCALVAVDGLGEARHLAVAPNGDLYVALLGGQNGGGGVVALRDTKGDGHFDMKESFGEGSSTGIALRNGYLYVAKVNSVERYKMTPGQLKPAGAVEIVVSGLEGERQHGDKGIAFRRERLVLRQCGRTLERLPNQGSAGQVAGTRSLPHPRKAWRHLEIR